MKENPRPFHRIAVLRGTAHRFAYLGLVLGSFALMMLGKADAVLMERMRTHLADAIVPILDVFSRPAGALAEAGQRIEHMARLHEENLQLREENARLLHWQTVARQMEAENKSLRAMHNLVPDPPISFVTGRVIANSGGAFARSLLLNSGARDGIAKGQTAITGEGLVGRVAGVGNRSARVLLITDLNSRLPVLLESGRTRAILAGDNSDRPHIVHLPPGADVVVGERVVTSGDGGAFPPGLPIGVVEEVGETAIKVRPFAALDRIEYVRVMDYGLEGILQTPGAIPEEPRKRGK